MSAFDSLIIADSIELLGAPNGTVSQNPLCPGAIFQLVSGYDLNAPQPTSDYVGSLILDGERPYGRRASDRTITLPIRITAADYTTLAAARELLMQTVDQQQWTLKWTRDATSAFAGGLGTPLPLVLDCFRAQPAVPLWGGPDGHNRSRVAMITLTFQALPYGHSDALVQVPVASPLPGQSAPPAPVVLDTFSSVSGTDFTQDTQAIVGPHSAKWTHGGSSPAPGYSKTGLSANLTGLTALSVYIGFGAAFPATFVNPVTVTFTLTDGTHTISFSVSRTFTPSDSASVPNFKLVTASIPQGRTFTYSAVTGYTISISSIPANPSGVFGFGFNTWLDHVVANPPSLQTATIRGAVYNLTAPQGTARTPISLQVQQPGVTKTVTLATPGPFQWTAPSSLSGGVADVTCIGAGGAGASLVASGEGAGGAGGEAAREASLAITAGTTYTGVVGAGGTPQTGITTLAITTTSLPSATVSSVYTSAPALQATGGTLPYTWSHTTGSIPTGLSLNASTGAITGTPSGSAVAPSLGFTVTDANGVTASTVLVLRVVIATTFAITTTSVPNGSVGARYPSTTLTTNGVGTAPVTWSVPPGTLPPGLALAATTGILSGTPTTTGTYAFTVTATTSDSTPKVDTQALSITITPASSSTAPIFGINSGAAWPPASYNDVYAAVQPAGQAVCFRFQGGKGSGPGGFPNAWNDPGSRGAKIPANATVNLGDWEQFDIPGLLAGKYDAGIKTFALSCQAQWNKNPGSVIVSMWHEADHLSAGAPTSAQVLGLHAYYYPRFKQWAPDVPYGQTFSRDALVANPSAWVSCKATISGGSDLDYYGVDGYDHGRTAAQVFNPAFAAIRSLVPHAVLAIPELNCTPDNLRNQYFIDAWNIATGATYGPLLLFQPFWMGVSNGQDICWLPGDTTVISTLIGIVNESAPQGSVPIGSDPPAVNGGATTFTGDSVTVTANGGTSATSNSPPSGATGSSNTVHHNGGAAAAGGTGSGSTPGTPYTVCTSTSTGSASHPITVGTGTTTGDAIVVSASSNSGNINSCADSKGNKYVLGQTQSGVALTVSIFIATTAADGVSPTVALTTSDTITVTFANSAAAQCVIVRGCSGVSSVAPLDVNIGAAATSTAPSSGSTGTLASASEWAVAALANSSGGGTPSSWTGGFTARSTQHTGATEFLTVADQTVSATTALTAAATITSAQWCIALVTLKFTATGAAYGGGAGSSAGQTAVGAAGALSVGGSAPDIGGDGGDGSTAPGTAPTAGMAPGGGGGGAAGTGAAIEGGAGADGAILITRTSGAEAFSTLIAHMPGPDAPPNLSPLVTFGTTGVAADGVTEYAVPQPVSGVNAGFAGTYSIVIVAGTTVAQPWNQPGVQRTVSVTVNQYEFTGGPVHSVTTSRTFTPVTDDPSGNGILPVGEVTLPREDVAQDNTACFYTVVIEEDSSGPNPVADLFLDVMFLDTTGQTVIISDPVDNAYETYYIDAPASTRDLGRILGTNGTRSSAISVIDQCVAISGGPLSLDPATNNMLLAYCCEGAPQLGISYFANWYLDRAY